MTSPRFDPTPFLHQDEGQHVERKSLFEGREGSKRARDRKAVRDQVAAYVAGFANAGRATDRGELAADRGELAADRGELPPDRGELTADRGELPPDRGELRRRPSARAHPRSLPAAFTAPPPPHPAHRFGAKP